MTQFNCGVDIPSATLQGIDRRAGAAGSFAKNPEGTALLVAFCHAHQAA